MKEHFLFIDYETRSECDLKKCGASEYSLHPSTQILCVGWRYGNRENIRKKETKSWSPAYESDYGELINALLNPEIKLVAHNSIFEQFITRNVLGRILSSRRGLREIPISRWICTASRSSVLALPRSLQSVGLALGLPITKDMVGHKLMLKMSKPRKATKNNTKKWHNKLSDLKRLEEYCRKDVDATVELFLSVPELIPNERKIWELDQKINHRGFLVDRPLIQTVLSMIEEEVKALDKETQDITGGEIRSVRQRDEVLKWLNRRGFNLPDLRADTVSEILKADIESYGIRLLEIRQAVSKTSTAKYTAFKNLSGTDGRCRDSLLYHGASTGRWTGKNVQVQNFPRGSVKDTDYACEVLKDGDLEMVRLIYGNPMEVFSSCLRGMIIPSPGKTLYCADYNAIETRVLFWLAGHNRGLEAYREKRDLYREMASIIFKKDLELITKEERDIGKRAILGCGYNMGHKKFFKTCKQYGEEITEELAEITVQAYRSTHSPIPSLWRYIERAAICAVEHYDVIHMDRLTWFFEKDFLYCRLPSGRRLAYYKPQVRYELTPWGEKAPKLYHYSINPVSKKWELSSTYGGLITENCCQAISRDLMAYAMFRLDAKGYDTLLTVHDEILAEKENGDLEEFKNIMAENPDWAKDLPIEVSGWEGKRCRK